MVRPFRTLLVLLLLFQASLAHGWRDDRPYTGIGLLIIRQANSQTSEEPLPLTLYADPGVRRVMETAPTRLPPMTRMIVTPPGEYAVAVAAKRVEWVRIAYDGAGREGWLRMERGWEYTPWERFLPGRLVTLLPRLGPAGYQLRQAPEDKAAAVATVGQRQELLVDRVEGDWVRASTATGAAGWLRWRDGVGRGTIGVAPLRP